jgi:glycosyltransferase involved in cell wall biosynthesis
VAVDVPVTAPHVVMAVANPIVTDARVRKTAASVRALGYKVTLLWADNASSVVTEGEMAGVRTLGLPVPYYLRTRSLAAMGQRARPPSPWFRVGYRDAAQRRVKAAQLAARRARLNTDQEPAALRFAALVHRLRAKALSVRLDRHQRRYENWRRGLSWDRELAIVADLDGVFGPWFDKLEPDVLHMHDVHLLSAAVHAKRRLTARGKPPILIYDAHEYVRGMEGGNPFWEAGYAAMERELAPEADAFITVSEPIADRLVTELDLPTRPSVVLNTPYLQAGKDLEAGPDLRTSLGLAPDVPLVAYAGVLHANRNLVPLIEAFGLLQGVHLALVCVPNAHYSVAAGLGEHAAKLGLSDRVHLIDPVAPAQVVRFLSTAWVGVHPMATGFPNHEMALPNKLFDYLWAGLPVAVSQVKAMADLVNSAGAGTTFNPEDPQSIASAIKRVLEDREQFAAAARDPGLKARFAWEAQAKKLAQLYAQVAPLGTPASNAERDLAQ